MSLQEGVWSSWEMTRGKIFSLELSPKLSSSHPSMSETYTQWTMASWNTFTRPVSMAPEAGLRLGAGEAASGHQFQVSHGCNGLSLDRGLTAWLGLRSGP